MYSSSVPKRRREVRNPKPVSIEEIEDAMGLDGPGFEPRPRPVAIKQRQFLWQRLDWPELCLVAFGTLSSARRPA